jgi:hypothetical protein
MYQDKIVLCACSAYKKKYYFNEDFKNLPEPIQQELKIMCVLFTEDVGGVLALEFDEDGNLYFRVEAEDGDGLFDEIGSALKIKELKKTKAELLNSLELYYKIFFLNEDIGL